MVEGLNSSRIAVLIPVRLSSSRLPEKALLKVLDKFMIEHLIDRVKYSEVSRIILCTTHEKEDDRIVEVAAKNNIDYFRGNKTDVLERYYAAALQYRIEYIVNVDGDDIFCEPYYINKTASALLNGRYDYVHIEGLPIGFYPVGIKTSALKKVCEIKNDENTEGWGRYFLKTGLFSICQLNAEEKHKMDNLRLTLDYQPDFELMSQIINRFKDKKPFFIDDILDLMRSQPELVSINDEVKELYWKNFNEKYNEIKLKEEMQ